MKKFLRRLAGCLLLALWAVQPSGALEIQSDDDVLRDFLWQQFVSLPKEERPKVGVALSAGGVRGFAHVGVLETLDNSGFPIDMISGTSMGSVIFCLPKGSRPLPIYSIFSTNNWAICNLKICVSRLPVPPWTLKPGNG